MQLDLFTHSRDIMLQNDVIAALRARDAVAGLHAFTLFESEFPRHENLSSLNTLLGMLTQSQSRDTDHNGVAARVSHMETTVIPAASRIFGDKEALVWLAPLWRTLAETAAGLPYRADAPNAHAAFLLLQSGDWDAAETAITGIPSWRRIPVPLSWMAQAHYCRGGLERAWPLLMELAWINAEAFDTLAPLLDGPPLRKLLRDFDNAFEDDGAPSRAWFPAWLLITAPALIAAIRETQACNGNAPERVARLIAELLTLEKQGRHADLVAQRKKLRDLHAGLYGIYMASR